MSFDGPAGERFRVTLVGAAANAKHAIAIVPAGDGPVTIEAFEVFEPPLKSLRPSATEPQARKDAMTIRTCRTLLAPALAAFVRTGGVLQHARANRPPAPDPPAFDEVVERLRDSGPRLFLNRQQIEEIRRNMTDNRRAYLDALVRRVDAYPERPRVNPQTIAQGTWLTDENDDWGGPAANAALAHLMTGRQAHLDKAANLLETAVESYRLRYENDRPIGWFVWSRMASLMAFDWIAASLPDERRQRLGRALFDHIVETQKIDQLPRPEGTNEPTLGFYGVAVLPWYAGIVFHGMGIDDEQALRWMRQGYRDHLTMFRHRSNMAGEDGGAITAAYGYAAGAYYHAEFNFYHAWQAAFGGSYIEHFPNLGGLPNWVLWNVIPGLQERVFHNFGVGDAWHNNHNRVQLPREYLVEFSRLYGDSLPEIATLARYLMSRSAAFNVAERYQRFDENPVFVPLLLDLPPDGRLPLDEREVDEALDNLPRAQRFANTGQFAMNSGWGPRDTHAMFIAGAATNNHKHFDENHFVIYREGFMALDTGARGGAGMTPYIGGMHEHWLNYYRRTVAHNGILIAMEGEEFFGNPEAVNDGGMNRQTGARVHAFETNEHYTYVASDAAAAYHPDKARQVLRQFVFVYPDYFVIFDRVVSRQPNQPKTWLLQMQDEPNIDGDTVRVDHWEGRMFSRTLLPENAAIEKIGGPGKEFWVAGQNWGLEPAERFRARYEGDHTLFGNWRIEVTPPEDRESERFLHLLQVGNQNELQAMTASELLRRDGRVGVAFDAADGARVEVLFNETGGPGGHVRIVKDGQPLRDAPLQ